jgi:hypothetical protein
MEQHEPEMSAEEKNYQEAQRKLLENMQIAGIEINSILEKYGLSMRVEHNIKLYPKVK